MREANVHVVKMINGQKQEIHICDKCAAEDADMGELAAGLGHNPIFGFSDLISGIFNTGNQWAGQVPLNTESIPTCDKCGMTLQEFQSKGKIGCAFCYNKFGQSIEPLLKRLHGSVVHKGRVPGNIAQKIKAEREIERFKELLVKAISEEAYEKAAELRDEIRSLEAQREEKSVQESTKKLRNPKSARKKIDGNDGKEV
jgi:protein arginine kinase activator